MFNWLCVSLTSNSEQHESKQEWNLYTNKRHASSRKATCQLKQTRPHIRSLLVKGAPACSTWPSAGLLTPWPLTGGSESSGNVTGVCEMPEAEVTLSCSAWEQTADLRRHEWRITRLFHDMFSHILQAFSGGTLAGDVWHVSGDAKALSLRHTHTHTLTHTHKHTDFSGTTALRFEKRWEKRSNTKARFEHYN